MLNKYMEVKYWILIFFLVIILALLLSITFGGIIYSIQKKNDKNLTLLKSFQSFIAPAIMFSVAIAFLIILKIEYDTPIQLLIFSCLIITGLLTSITTHKYLIFLITLGFILIYLFIPIILNLLKDLFNSSST